MRVDEWAVIVPMRVPSGHRFMVFVVVVPVVVVVFVFMGYLVMGVLVNVGGLQRHGHAHCGQQAADDLGAGDRISQNDPGQHSADERGGGEDDLPPSRSEIAGSFDPQHDRRAIAGGTDQQGCQDFTCADVSESGADGHPEHQVGRSCDETLQQHDVFGAELVDLGGDAVVEAPGDTRPGDQQRSDAEVSAWLPAKHDPGGGDQYGSGDDPAAEMFPEHGGRQGDGGRKLQVQQD